MSGLFGYLDPQSDLPPDTVEKMGHVMASPADQSFSIFRAPRVGIGCISKRIYPGEGDLLVGDDSDRVGMCFGRLIGLGAHDGTSDAATLARKAFLDDASDSCLASANGPFAAVVWDERRATLELVTDRYGMYPVYVANHQSAVLFATQIKALLAVGVLSRKLNPVALTLMTTIGELVGEHTPLEGVRLLPAASRATFTHHAQSVTRYWHYSFTDRETDLDQTARRLGRRLEVAVERICSTSGTVGVPLSGGLDSRVVLASTPDPSTVPSFTWGIPGCRDMRYAPTAARILQSPHYAYEYEPDHLERSAAPGVWITEGQLPSTDFHVLPFVDRMAQHCNVVLNGYAGDAVLGGNFTKAPWWHAADRANAAAALWQWRDATLHEAYRTSLLGDHLEDCGLNGARSAFVDEYLKTPGRSTMDAAMAFLLDNRVRRYTACGTSLLRWRLESDHPFFDNDFFDAVCRVPHSWRFRHRLYIRMMQTCFADAARVRWQRTGLPASSSAWLVYASLALHRLGRLAPLKPFFHARQAVNFPAWFRGPLRSFTTNLLCDDRTLGRGLFDADTLRRVVSDHMNATSDNAALLGSLITVELFTRLFVDTDSELTEHCRVQPPKAQEVGIEAIR